MSLNIALSGLTAASSDLRVIGNNVANANTTAFKRSDSDFADLYASNAFGSSTGSIGSGVSFSGTTQTFSQGTITPTGKPLDIAINGDGFFELERSNGELSYSRAGSFRIDKDGFLTTPQDTQVRGYEADLTQVPATITANIEPLNIERNDIPPNATSAVDIEMNLPSLAAEITATFDETDPDTYTSSTSTTIYDTTGATHEMRFYFVRVAGAPLNSQRWNMFTAVDPNDGGDLVEANGLAAPAPPPVDDPVVFDFDASGQMITNIDPAGVTAPIFDIGAGLTIIPGATQEVTVDFSTTTQFASAFALQDVSQDGYSDARLDRLEVEEDGNIFGRYTNGQSRILGQFLLVNFANPTGLTPLGDTAWGQSFDSGAPVRNPPGTGSSGFLKSAALEDANVDLTRELVDLIISQQHFTANSKTLQTNDEVIQRLLNV